MDNKSTKLRTFRKDMIDKYGTGIEETLNHKLLQLASKKKCSSKDLNDIEGQLSNRSSREHVRGHKTNGCLSSQTALNFNLPNTSRVNVHNIMKSPIRRVSKNELRTACNNSP